MSNDSDEHRDGAQRLEERTDDDATMTKVFDAGTKPPAEMSTSELKREYDALLPAIEDDEDRLFAIGEELEDRGVDTGAI